MTMIAIPSPDEVARNPELFARKFLKIQDKGMRTVPLAYNPTQLHYLTHRTPRDLILKPRQIGFTTAIQAENFRYCTTRPESIITLGKDDENTKEIRRIWKFFYDNLPENFRPRRLYDNATLTTFPDCGSRAVIGTAGSVDVGRGGTRTRMHGSEVAFWVDAQSIINGALQAGNLKWVALESTANGASGWFFDRCMEALQGGGVWKLHFYAWFTQAEYRLPLPMDTVLSYTDTELALIAKHQLTAEQINWRRDKIAEMGGLDDFLQEYPEDPLTCFKKSGIGYFGNVDHALKAPLAPTFDPAHRYVAGLDFGQQQDYTALMIIDATANHMVDLVRVRHERWAEMRKAVLNACKAWDVRIMHAEKNSMGSSEIESLYTEFEAAGLRTDIIPFNMTAVNKPSLMAHYRSALHEGGLLLQDLPVIRHELDSAVSKQTLRGWTVESPRDGDSGHGDTVVAGALANYSIGFI